ncbi:hypothetical protein FB451DRAFT_44731 [Mycena latifolia]|nr:hypothetical protein FB451DRAFT_44731 [Mycena latifolia]
MESAQTHSRSMHAGPLLLFVVSASAVDQEQAGWRKIRTSLDRLHSIDNPVENQRRELRVSRASSAREDAFAQLEVELLFAMR